MTCREPGPGPTTDLGHGASVAQNSHTVSAAASGWWDPCRQPFSACAAVRQSMACEDRAGSYVAAGPKRGRVVVIVQGCGWLQGSFWNIYPAHDFAGRLCEGCGVGAWPIYVCLTGGLFCSRSRPAGRIEKKSCAHHECGYRAARISLGKSPSHAGPALKLSRVGREWQRSREFHRGWTRRETSKEVVGPATATDI